MTKTTKPMETEKENLIKGLFSTQTICKIGTGVTQRKTVQKMYWFATEQKNGDIEIQALNFNNVPAGPKKIVSRDEFLDNYTPEPEMYTKTVFPKMRELTKTIALADRHRQNGETYSAEHEYSKVLNIDEENIRANFGLGLTYLERGDKQKGADILERLVKLDATFDREHKHLFNEFGISLRKNQLLDESIGYYERAEKLAPKDENLYYNMARAYFDKKEMKKVGECLNKALQINKNMEEAQKFLEYMKKKKLIP